MLLNLHFLAEYQAQDHSIGIHKIVFRTINNNNSCKYCSGHFMQLYTLLWLNYMTCKNLYNNQNQHLIAYTDIKRTRDTLKKYVARPTYFKLINLIL